MTTIASTEQSIFDTMKPLCSSEAVKKMVSSEILESLILCRISQVKLSTLGRSEVLKDSIVKSIQATAETIRQYDMKIRSRISSPAAKAALSAELCKEKLMDIGEMISIAMQISSDDKEDYENYMYMMTDFLNKLLRAQKHGKALNTAKYKALMSLVADELKADAEGGTSMFDYCSDTGEVTVQMVHPNNIADAKLTVK